MATVGPVFWFDGSVWKTSDDVFICYCSACLPDKGREELHAHLYDKVHDRIVAIAALGESLYEDDTFEHVAECSLEEAEALESTVLTPQE